MKKFIENIKTINIYTLIVLVATLVVSILLLVNLIDPSLGVPKGLGISQLLLVVALIVIGKTDQMFSNVLKLAFNPLIQIVLAAVFGTIAAIWATDVVAKLIPEDPYLFKDALLAATMISWGMLWVMGLFFILMLLYFLTGYKILRGHNDNDGNNKPVQLFVAFIGLSVGIVVGYSQVLTSANSWAKSYGFDWVVNSQFQENIRCSNLDRETRITTVSNNEVLELVPRKDGSYEFVRHNCLFVKRMSSNTWE